MVPPSPGSSSGSLSIFMVMLPSAKILLSAASSKLSLASINTSPEAALTIPRVMSVAKIKTFTPAFISPSAPKDKLFSPSKVTSPAALILSRISIFSAAASSCIQTSLLLEVTVPMVRSLKERR